MKILFDSTELSYWYNNSGHRAGVFFAALNIFRELKKRGIDITFCCNFKRYFFMREVISQVEEFQGIELLKEHSLPNIFFGLLNYTVRFAPLKLRYLVLSISRYYENLFYIVSPKNKDELAEFGICFCPFTPFSKEIMTSSHIKRFRMLHDIIPILEAGKIPQNPRTWCYRVYNSINKNDFYVTNSENTRKDILKYFDIPKENIKTTYLGAAGCFKPEKNNNSEKYVFSLCSLGKRKNLIFVIKNFFEFIERNKINDLQLVLGGGIWKKFEKELTSTINKFDTSKITLLGYVKDEELPRLYSNATVFVYPSLYEGFGLPVLEAMKCGCPVITSNVSSLPEVIGNAGIQVDPRNDEEMIKAYEKMYYDKFFRELCAERGLIRSRNFSWEKCVSELLEFIETKGV